MGCTMETLTRVLLQRSSRPSVTCRGARVGRSWASVLSSATQDVVPSGSVEAWVRLLLLPGCVLGTHGVRRGSDPGTATRKSHHLTSRRAADCEAGRIFPLIEGLLSAEVTPRPTSMASESACRERARCLVGEVHFCAAIRYPLAPVTSEAIRAVQNLFPEGPGISQMLTRKSPTFRWGSTRSWPP